MSKENELKELMGLVGALAQDTALYMGNVVQINKVETSAKVLEDRLRALLTELEAARKDAARYRHIRMRGSFGETEELMSSDQVVYVSIGFRGHNIDAAIDAARKGEA